MNELPVIGSLCLRKDFWNHHRANIASIACTHYPGNHHPKPQRAGREWDPVTTYTKLS